MSQRLALLVGSSLFEPPLPPLRAAPGDLAALTKVLGDPAIGGFDQVTPILDAASDKVRREVARFFAKRTPDDLLLLYFTGHGLLDDRGALHLAVRDTESDFLSATAIPAGFVTAEMDQCRSRRQILILDCCYSGAFERGAKGQSAIPATTFEGNGLGRYVLTASSSTERAWEPADVVAAGQALTMSVFTRHLIHGLETGEADLDNDGQVTLDELYNYVHKQVVQENPRQNPRRWSYQQQGTLVIAQRPGWRPPLPDLPVELRQALDSSLAGVREGALRELPRYLLGPDPTLRDAARIAAQHALNDDSKRVATAAAEVLAGATTAAAKTAEATSAGVAAAATDAVALTVNVPTTSPASAGATPTQAPAPAAAKHPPIRPPLDLFPADRLTYLRAKQSPTQAAQVMLKCLIFGIVVWAASMGLITVVSWFSPPVARLLAAPTDASPAGTLPLPGTGEKSQRKDAPARPLTASTSQNAGTKDASLAKGLPPPPRTNAVSQREGELPGPQTSSASQNARTKETAQALLAEARSWQLSFPDAAGLAKGFAAGWDLVNNTYVSSTVADGVLRFSITKDRDAHDTALALPAIGDDFYLRVNLTQIVGNQGAVGGLFFWRHDFRHVYKVALSTGKVSSVVSDGGPKYTLRRPFTVSTAIHPPGRTNALVVIGKGDEIFTYINDQQVDRFPIKTSWRSGFAGIFVEADNGTATFDFADFELRTAHAATGELDFDNMRTK